MPTRTVSALHNEVSQLAELDREHLERMRHEALTVPIPWTREYGDYQSGNWWTSSLMNGSGSADDVLIGDCEAQPTELLKEMPAIAEFLAGLGLSYMWVRLARLTANSFLWEHRDYNELSEVPRHRLHIPLHTNSSAFLVTAGHKVHLVGGRIWRLTPTYAHGVCNLLGPDRVHMIADVYEDDACRTLFAEAADNSASVVRLPTLSVVDRAAKLTAARTLAGLGYTQAAEQLLLRLFFQYALPEGAAYDLVAALHEGRGDEESAAAWTAAKKKLLAQGD